MPKPQNATRTNQTMKMPEIRSSLHTSVLVIAAVCVLAGCDDLTRFEQERYECGHNPEGLVEIDFREFKKGGETAVVFNDETLTMSIVESSDERFTLASPGLIVRVDRGSGTIRLTRGSRYRNVKCTKSKIPYVETFKTGAAMPDPRAGSMLFATVEGHNGLCLFKRQACGIGDRLFGRAATGQFDGPAHPDFAANIICEPHDIPAQRIEPGPAFIHCVDHTIAGLCNLAPTLCLQLQKLIMFMKAFFKARQPRGQSCTQQRKLQPHAKRDQDQQDQENDFRCQELIGFGHIVFLRT